MELVNEFRVPVPVATAWKVLTDVDRVAPCLPGATLLSVDGDDFTGSIKVKVGPITASYKGHGGFQEKDEANYRAVLKGNAKETRGQGNAAATITAQLTDEGDSTACTLTTDLAISGKAAQFGRGVLADVSAKLIDQFAKRLEEDVLAHETTAPLTPSPDTAALPAEEVVATPATPGTAALGSTEPTPSSHDDDASLDLLSVVALPLAKRALPVVAGVGAGLAAGWLLGRRSGT